MRELVRLEATLRTYRSVLVGYSGGVDSSLVAVAARRALGPERVLAAIGRSASYPAEQWRRAVEVARRFDVPLLEVATDELDDPRYRANPTNRCYFCKRVLWSRLVPLARARGLRVVVDGTNADDLSPAEHRPGFAAGRASGVRTPLADLGFTKDAVREMARALGLPNWSAPAAPCLSSRVRYGLPITRERLHQVEAAEEALRGFGLRGNVRVRHLGEDARVEVDATDLTVARSVWPAIAARLRALGFAHVELDPAGYRRGAMVMEATHSSCGSSSP